MADSILVLAEQLQGELATITHELLGVGRRLADERGVPLHAVLLGSGVEAPANQCSLADRVMVVENEELDLAAPGVVAAVLEAVLEQAPAKLVLLGATNASMGVGSMLAMRAGSPLVNFCRSLRYEAGILVATSQLFGGKVLADVRLAEGRGIVSVCLGAYAAEEGRSDRTATVSRLDVPVTPSPIRFEALLEPEAGDVDITKQQTLVAIGRGIQSQDNVELAEELAAALGGAVCASRPVIDQGWLPLSRQVGKSGMSVQPRLYLALGISGAPEHWEGMQGAETIVAVNTDPQAPVFDGAHYGVVADAIDIMPLLTEKLQARG